jgi:hypothetical protein
MSISTYGEQGSSFMNVNASLAGNYYPTDGIGGNTTTAASSSLVDAKLVVIQAIVFRTSSTAQPVSIRTHDGVLVAQNVTPAPIGSGSRVVDFGPTGLRVTQGIYVQTGASNPAFTLIYKKLL